MRISQKPFDAECEEVCVLDFFQIQRIMTVIAVFLLILNLKEFYLVQNHKENCHHDHRTTATAVAATIFSKEYWSGAARRWLGSMYPTITVNQNWNFQSICEGLSKGVIPFPNELQITYRKINRHQGRRPGLLGRGALAPPKESSAQPDFLKIFKN